MTDLFKTKDYRPEFENRCHSKVEEKVLKTRERHGLERAKIEENVRKSVCACIAPHANRDIDVVWEAMSETSNAMRDTIGSVAKYENRIGTIIAPIPKTEFHERCLKKMVEHEGNRKKEIEEIGIPICRCLTDNVLPFVGKNVPTFIVAMYDAKHSLRDEKTIKKFEEKMTLEAMKKRGDIP